MAGKHAKDDILADKKKVFFSSSCFPIGKGKYTVSILEIFSQAQIN